MGVGASGLSKCEGRRMKAKFKHWGRHGGSGSGGETIQTETGPKWNGALERRDEGESGCNSG